MGRKSLFSQFNNLPYYTKESLKTSAKRLDISNATLNTYIQRGIKSRDIISLKRNFYTSKGFYDSNRKSLSYVYTIGNKLIEPSYISRETALNYYGILSEANTTVITSVTPKTSRKFTNNLGIYAYKSIRDDLFAGFVMIDKEFTMAIAEPYKAIFDYLYYRLPLEKLRNKNIVLDSIEEFRLDIDDIGESELTKLFNLIKSI